MLVTKLTAIADAIRGKTGKTEGLTLDQMATEIAGIEAGGGGGDNLLEYTVSLYMAFNNVTFEEGTELNINLGAKTSVVNSNPFYCTFQGTKGLKSITIACKNDPSTAISYQNFVRMSVSEYTLEKIDLTGAPNLLKVSNMSRTFEYRRGLREILGEFDLTNSSTVGSIAGKCDALETIQFKAGTIRKSISFPDSPNLTDATIQNIVDGLADMTGGTAPTLTLHATVGAKLTDAQKSTASAKNWTISY